MQNFTYNTLDSSKIQIRLVCIDRDSDKLQLRCSIKIVSLHDNPEYTALSYTWGDPSPASLLTVKEDINDSVNNSEVVLHITKSVEIALQHLRDSTSIVALWIDQLCINQNNMVEKSSQVQLMKAIYEGAKDVIVWLGPAVDESDHLIGILTKIGTKASEAGIFQPNMSVTERTKAFGVSYSELTKLNSLGPDFTIPMESLRSFLDRPWWTRIWVVQELSVARSVAFACGAQQISYEHLRNALYFCAIYIPKFDLPKRIKEFQARHSAEEILFDPEKQKAFVALCSAPVASAAEEMLTSRHLYRSKIENGGGHKLYDILKFSHVIGYTKTRLEATNHRDKIYGLLGLARDAKELGIEPDYRKSCASVYIEVAKALISSGHVDLLWFCQFPKSMYLPSWTPDWSAHIQTPYGDKISASSRSFAASGKTTQDIVQKDDIEGFITLKGAFVGEVDVIGSAYVSPPEGKGGKLFEAASTFIQEINQFLDEVPVSGAGAGMDSNVLEEARWRTPIGDKEWNRAGAAQRATESSCKIYEEVLRRIEAQRDLSITPKQRLLMQNFPIETGAGLSFMNFMKEMYNRRPFRTKNGYVGLGPVGMLPNDVVCIVFGAQVPYILRLYKSSQYQLWQLVG